MQPVLSSEKERDSVSEPSRKIIWKDVSVSLIFDELIGYTAIRQHRQDYIE